MERISYQLIRSRRRTLGMEIRDGRLIVRAPLRCSGGEIERFVRAHSSWILRQMARSDLQTARAEQAGRLEETQIRELKQQAMQVIPKRVQYYAPLIGVDYGRITIRCQKTRWGSCSSKGNLSFNCLLMLAPLQVLDSVVVHELCHRKQMNHSQAFYREVYRVFPEYNKWHRWLKTNGAVLLKRVPDGRS
ncbi:MAG: M48 family metallopeptidase [Parasporobacterium sp.]|nr:M48 family metallopeptidase [Parasporobacterium sp.]